VLLALVVLMAVPPTQCLREDEVDCEEAVQHMKNCCPTFSPTAVQCYYNDTCGVTYPDLTPAESRCILDASCRELAESDICGRVTSRSQGAEAPETTTGLDGEVCP
jgi:hypothetical protein